MAHPSLNVLVLSDFTGKDANVVRDYLYCFNQHSRHHFYYLHSWSKNQFRRLVKFDFNRFDAIILFWDFFWIGSDDPLSYCHVPTWVSDRIAESRALKIQFLQDEYRDVRLANRVMAQFGVNLMFSCVAPKDQELFYPRALIPSLIKTYPVLTGYVPSYLENVTFPASIDREIDIGYRSRKLPYYLGDLGQEKFIIADRFQQIADRYGFNANISVLEKDRIYGDDWLAFMKACRFSLGTESGSSVVDFDGQIKKRCLAYLRDHPSASFDETRAAVFPDVDGKVVVQTISPRIFEAAAFENTLILHEGHYEGMLEPDTHYISVKKDYSNTSEVVERMKDRGFCERLARNAKDKLIESRDYNYASFVRQFDDILEGHSTGRARTNGVSRTFFYLMNYLNNDRIIPRGGVALSIPHTCDVVHHYNHNAPYVVVLMCSLSVILGFVCQSPTLVVRIIQNALKRIKRQGVSLAGAFKDLRILALFFQMRAGVRGRQCPPFDLHLVYDINQRRLTARTVPRATPDQKYEHEATVRLTAEKSIVDDLVEAGAPLEFQWDNQLLGNALPLRWIGSGNYCIDLNEDCIYPFDHINRLQVQVDAEQARLLKNLLLGGWKEPSLFGRCCGMLFLCGVLGYYLLCEKPIAWVRSTVGRLMPRNDRPVANGAADARR